MPSCALPGTNSCYGFACDNASYVENMLGSALSLHLPGSSPDSGRLWEALEAGAVPAVVEDFGPGEEQAPPRLYSARTPATPLMCALCAGGHAHALRRRGGDRHAWRPAPARRGPPHAARRQPLRARAHARRSLGRRSARRCPSSSCATSTSWRARCAACTTSRRCSTRCSGAHASGGRPSRSTTRAGSRRRCAQEVPVHRALVRLGDFKHIIRLKCELR